MSQTNRIEKVAIVGAGGHVGGAITSALLATGKHTVTAITRGDSTAELPQGIKVARVDYSDPSTLVSALRGQDFLVITLAVTAPPETHSTLVSAAVEAKVRYIMPNVYGSDILNVSLGKEDLYGEGALQRCSEIAHSGGVSSYIAMVCGFWYVWSLGWGPQAFGFDIRHRKATFFDDGEQKINVSTWEQCGRALAALLSLPENISSGDESQGPTVSQWKNKPLYTSSFLVSQRDMLDSLNRVCGTTDADWEIMHESSAERYQAALAQLKNGERLGFVKAMYTRTFFPNGGGEYESIRELVNGKLGLPKEDLDAETKKAVDVAMSLSTHKFLD